MIVLNILIAAAVLALVHLLLELHQRDVHLQWTDDRDLEFARFFEKAWALTLLPKNNPLDGFKQHGMLAKDAFMRSDTLLPMLDERLDAMNGATTGLVRSAKSLMQWEQTHPMPPKHYWQAWRSDKMEATQEEHHGRADSDDRPSLSQGAVGSVPDDQATH